MAHTTRKLLLTEQEAADALSVSARFLQEQRYQGGGPRYVKVGRLVRYRPSDLHAYMEANVRASTSDTGEG